MELVVSDAHGGIKAAIAAVLGEASWQRCRTHFMANLATRIPKASWPMIATLVRSIFEQPDRDATWDQLGDVVDKLTQAGFSDVGNRDGWNPIFRDERTWLTATSTGGCRWSRGRMVSRSPR